MFAMGTTASSGPASSSREALYNLTLVCIRWTGGEDLEPLISQPKLSKHTVPAKQPMEVQGHPLHCPSCLTAATLREEIPTGQFSSAIVTFQPFPGDYCGCNDKILQHLVVFVCR